MRIWLVHQYATLPQQAGLTRAFDYCKALAERGHSVRIIAGSFDHFSSHQAHLANGENKLLEQFEGVEFLWLRTSAYRGNSLARIINMLQFMWKVMRLKVDNIPDVIIGSSPSPFAAFGAQRLARRLNVPFVFEVRDLWPESIVDLGRISRRHPLVWLLSRMQRSLCRSACAVATVLPNSEQYIHELAVRPVRVEWLPNGVTGTSAPQFTLGNNARFTLMYCGSHGLANNLEDLLQAAKILERDFDGIPVHIRLVGEGANKAGLRHLVQELGLTCVTFEKPVAKRDVRRILVEADAYILLFKDVPLYRYGISANKLFDYLAMGHPILFVGNGRYHPYEDCSACIRILPGSPMRLAEAIVSLARMSSVERDELGRAGPQFVSSHFLIPDLAARMEHLLEDVRSMNP